MRNISVKYLIITVLLIFGFSVKSQKTTLSDCFILAKENSYSIKQSNYSLLAKKYAYQAEKLSFLPKVDLLASYNYLSNPIEINMGTIKNGVVEGSSQQNVATANSVYKEITGSDLPQNTQNQIYQTSKEIISTAYPNYNPALSQQQYLVAAIGVRQPIYLGGKLSAARSAAATGYKSGEANNLLVNNEQMFATALQYIRILYINTLLNLEKKTIEAVNKNNEFASSLVRNEIIPPYQQNWTKVMLIQAKNRYNNIALDKENAMAEMNRLLGIKSDTILNILDTLVFVPINNFTLNDNFWQDNPLYKYAQLNTAIAKTSTKSALSLVLPNLFGIANINLYQKDLPLITPPWMIGIEFQWNIFDGLQGYKRIKASKQLNEEAKIMEENTRVGLQSRIRISQNKLMSAKNEISSLDSARNESIITTKLITERAKNNLSSPKDINDALLVQIETEKAYYTSIFGYYIALAEYYNIMGVPQSINDYIK